MRTEFYILWADEKEIHKDLSCKLKSIIVENIYYTDNGEEIGKIVDKKKKNKIKLIISYVDENNAESIINGVRDFYGTEIACLIFSKNKEQLAFAKSIKNVLFTSKFEDVIKYAQISLTLDAILEFSQNLQKDYDTEFSIDELKIVDFNESVGKSLSLKKNKK